jgi:hypothetical protein
VCNRLGEQGLGLLQIRRELRAEPLDPLFRPFKPRIEILDAPIGLIRREEQRAPAQQLELLFQRPLPVIFFIARAAITSQSPVRSVGDLLLKLRLLR